MDTINNAIQLYNHDIIEPDCFNTFVCCTSPEYNFHLPGSRRKRKKCSFPCTYPSGEITDLAVTDMDNFDLEPKYTTNEVPGRCLKCLAEKNLNNCLFALLSEKTDDVELQQQYQALLTLLESPDFESLRSQTEKLLSEGKQAKVKVYYHDGQLHCELVTD